MTFELRFKDKKETGPEKSKGERLRLKELECKGRWSEGTQEGGRGGHTVDAGGLSTGVDRMRLSFGR